MGLTLLASVLAAAYVFATRWEAPKAVDDDDARPVAQSAQAAAAKAAGTVTLDAEAQGKGGIVAAAPKDVIYQEKARAYGVVLPLDRLTSLYNDASAAAQRLKAAEIKLSASQGANVRAQNLLKVFPSAAAQADAADAAAKIDAANVDAARDRIDALKNTAVQDWGSVLGPAIAARAPLAENLVRRQSALIQLTLQPGVEAQAPARIDVAFGTGATAQAELVSPATQTDPKIASASFLYVAPASPAALSGASVSAWLPKGEARASVVIPPAAVVWQDGKAWIYVKAAADRFQRKPLDDDATPTADGGFVLPADLWPQGQSLVVEGAQALVSEESKSLGKSDEDSD